MRGRLTPSLRQWKGGNGFRCRVMKAGRTNLFWTLPIAAFPRVTANQYRHPRIPLGGSLRLREREPAGFIQVYSPTNKKRPGAKGSRDAPNSPPPELLK